MKSLRPVDTVIHHTNSCDGIDDFSLACIVDHISSVCHVSNQISKSSIFLLRFVYLLGGSIKLEFCILANIQNQLPSSFEQSRIMKQDPWRLRFQIDELEEKLVDLSVEQYPVFITKSECSQFVSNTVRLRIIRIIPEYKLSIWSIV